MKKLVCVLAFALCAAAPALAENDRPKAEVFLGYSYARADLLIDHDSAHGWEASIAGNFHKNIGVEADFSGHYGRFVGVGFQNNLFLFGPRVAAGSKVRPFAHALLGLANSKALGASSNDFATAFGGGLDVGGKRVALRLGQLDYVFIREPFGSSDNSHNLRYSTGVVFRW